MPAYTPSLPLKEIIAMASGRERQRELKRRRKLRDNALHTKRKTRKLQAQQAKKQTKTLTKQN